MVYILKPSSGKRVSPDSLHFKRVFHASFVQHHVPHHSHRFAKHGWNTLPSKSLSSSVLDPLLSHSSRQGKRFGKSHQTQPVAPKSTSHQANCFTNIVHTSKVVIQETPKLPKLMIFVLGHKFEPSTALDFLPFEMRFQAFQLWL